MTDGKIRISQCMIVKNEEKNIERALSWGRLVMWEQIIVDTGSTDRTVELAHQMGAKLYEFPWINDFAAAKNYGIEQCGGDWIAFLDADEYMGAEDVKKLLPIIENLHKRGADGLSVSCKHLDEKGEIFASGTQVRFFRNTPDIRYRRRIHEQLESVSGKELRLGDGVKELSVFHTGYGCESLKEKKSSRRNQMLIQEELKENPCDYEMMGYMGDECLSDGDGKSAKMWYRRAVEYMPPKLRENDQRSAATFTNLLRLLSEEEGNSWEQLSDIYEKAVEMLPEESDFDYIAGYFFAVRGLNEEAVFYLEEALRKLDIYGYNNKAILLAGNLLGVYELLTKCCLEAGKKEKCAAYAMAYLQNNRYDMAVLTRLLKVLIPEGQKHTVEEYGAVTEFLGKIYDFSLLKDKLMLVKTAETCRMEGLRDFILKNMFTKDEKRLLKL